VENADDAAVSTDYNVEIEDMRFEYRVLMGMSAPEQPIHIPLRDYDIQYHELTSQADQMLQFIIPENTHRMAFFFQSNNFYYNRTGYSKSDFTVNLDPDNANAASDLQRHITGFYFRYGDREAFPNPPARFNLLAAGDSAEANKIYKDTCNALVKTRSFEHVSEWVKAPFFVVPFAHADEPILKDNKLHLQLAFNGVNAGFRDMRIWLICEHEKVLTMQYEALGLRDVQIE
jgi:hypothetical protein